MATQKTSTRKIGSVAGVIFTISGLVWLVGGLEQVACRWDDSLGIPAGTILEALPSIFLAAWHILQPCALVHLRVLDGLLGISVPCWHFVLFLAGVA